MDIHFEPNLKHQKTAIDAVVRVFEGASYPHPNERLWDGEVSGNVMDIGIGKIRENVRKLAKEQGIIDYAPTDEPDFSIEMETGTGKTYVYIRTIFQLHREYGLHKFIIVTPRVAIREGVLATLNDTRKHFWGIYGQAASVIKYDSKNLSDVMGFCTTNHLSIMVLNKQSFDSDKKILNDERRDRRNLLDLLQRAQPVIIMDEPQEGMDTQNMQKRLGAFNPLFKLRYSATHRRPKNVINRLSPYVAYNDGYVKKIAVLSIHETNTQSNVSIKFRSIRLNRGNQNPTASLILNVRLRGGEIKGKVVSVKRLDDLAKKTNNPVYVGWVIEDIGTTDIFDGKAYVKFTNGEQIEEGGILGSNKEDIFRQQIRRTIQNHFHRKEKLRSKNIKPLALFFIDRVANYVNPDGLIRRLFVEEYTTLYKEKFNRAPSNIDAIHGGYFAKTSKGKYTDHVRSMESEASRAIYDRILKKKYELISFEDPLEFIFSHSALGVGWDNPNVFTICTLNESISQIRKRQEIGRGLRLCVQQNGKRYRDPPDTQEGDEVNLLTVVPNESYQAFVSTYQTELREELGEHVKPPKIRNHNRKPDKIKRVNDRFISNDFLCLWDKIAIETRCRVHFQERSLIHEGVKALSEIVVTQNELEISLHRWATISREGIDDPREGETSERIKGRYAAMNVVDQLACNTALAWTTIASILSKLPEEQQCMLSRNPMKFIAEATKILRRIVSHELVRLLYYEETGRSRSLDELFSAEIETRRDMMPTPKRGLYDHIICDSGVEKEMAAAFDNHSTVRLFLKLPDKYKIPTPIGNYTPDFALVMEKRDLDDPHEETKFYFIIETKGASDLGQLTMDAQIKIKCALKHFETLGMRCFLAPVDSVKTFDEKALKVVGETFFNR